MTVCILEVCFALNDRGSCGLVAVAQDRAQWQL